MGNLINTENIKFLYKEITKAKGIVKEIYLVW